MGDIVDDDQGQRPMPLETFARMLGSPSYMPTCTTGDELLMAMLQHRAEPRRHVDINDVPHAGFLLSIAEMEMVMAALALAETVHVYGSMQRREDPRDMRQQDCQGERVTDAELISEEEADSLLAMCPTCYSPSREQVPGDRLCFNPFHWGPTT